MGLKIYAKRAAICTLVNNKLVFVHEIFLSDVNHQSNLSANITLFPDSDNLHTMPPSKRGDIE